MTVYLREFCKALSINSSSYSEERLPVEVPEKTTSMTGYYQPFSRTFRCKKPSIDQHRLNSSYQTLPDPESEKIKDVSNLGKTTTYSAPRRHKRSLSNITPHILPSDYNSDMFTITRFHVTNADHRSISFFNWQTFETITLPLMRQMPKLQSILFIDPSITKIRPLAFSNRPEDDSGSEMQSSPSDESESEEIYTESLSSSLSDSSECGETLSASEVEFSSDESGYDSEKSPVSELSPSLSRKLSYSG